MHQKAINILIDSDTFRLFTRQRTNRLFEILENLHSYADTDSVKGEVVKFFESELMRSEPESLRFTEAMRLIAYSEKLFEEVKGAADSSENTEEDTLVNEYSECLRNFCQDIDVDIIQKYMKHVLQ